MILPFHLPRIFCFVAIFSTASSCVPAAGPVDFGVAGIAGKLGESKIDEASGVAASTGGGWWVVNDTNLIATMFRIDETGNLLSLVTMPDIDLADCEDLGTFRWRGVDYLALADIGDNAAERPERVIHIVREPSVNGGAGDEAGAAWGVRFRFPDGPRDAESCAPFTDADGKLKFLILSKRTNPPEVYEVRAGTGNSDEVHTAQKIGSVQVLPPPLFRAVPYSSQPTSLDISPNGTLAAVLTYWGVFVFEKSADESWPSAFSRGPVWSGPHHLIQAEAVAFDSSGEKIVVLSEGSGSAIRIFTRVKAEP